MADDRYRKDGLLVMWAHPRSMSTAFERMMAARGDAYIVHEPFCTLVDTGRAVLPAPGGGEVTLERIDQCVDFLLETSRSRLVFVKETTEYRYDPALERADFLKGAGHVFMIREPARTIASHYAMNPKLRKEEVGYQNLLDVRDAIVRAGSEVITILEAEALRADPHGTVEAFCDRVGIPFVEGAMSWTPVVLDEWSRTAHWHRAAGESTGFGRLGTAPRDYAVTVETDERLRSIYETQLPLYARLKELANVLGRSERLNANTG